MLNYSTRAHNLKRGIFTFCEKLTPRFKKPVQKFICEMIFGLIASQSSHLTQVARKLNELILLKKTVERLSNRLASFQDNIILQENYVNEIKHHFDEETILIVDDSDVNKDSSKKLDSLCRVRDGSTGDIVTGYWYAGVTALTANKQQPIPVYGRVYSSTETGYKSNNNETIKSLEFLSKHFDKENIRTFDRGYDGGFLFDYLIPRKEKFIVRSVGDRNCIHNGKTILVEKLAKKIKPTHSLHFETKDGDETDCQISITPIKLPKYPEEQLQLVVCHGFGKKPLMLITNLKPEDDRLCLTVTKVYFMRWRIEEFYKFKKQTFGFENFLVRSLTSIRNLDLLLNIAIGYMGTLSEKAETSVEVHEIVLASKRLYGLAKFTFYAISDGLVEIFSKGYTGVQSFFKRTTKQLDNGQIRLFEWG